MVANTLRIGDMGETVDERECQEYAVESFARLSTRELPGVCPHGSRRVALRPVDVPTIVRNCDTSSVTHATSRGAEKMDMHLLLK